MPAYRSRTTTHGRNMAGARGLWRATGMKNEDFGKPIIAVVNSFTQFVPGHVHLKDLGQLVAREIEKAGGVAKEFNTIAVDDGIAMGHDGMLYSLPSREIIADSVEYMVNAHCADAMVCISNCDKITPGMLMAALRINIPTVFVSGGPMESGKVNHQGQDPLGRPDRRHGRGRRRHRQRRRRRGHRAVGLSDLRILLGHVHGQLHELPDRGARPGAARQRLGAGDPCRPQGTVRRGRPSDRRSGAPLLRTGRRHRAAAHDRELQGVRERHDAGHRDGRLDQHGAASAGGRLRRRDPLHHAGHRPAVAPGAGAVQGRALGAGRASGGRPPRRRRDGHSRRTRPRQSDQSRAADGAQQVARGRAEPLGHQADQKRERAHLLQGRARRRADPGRLQPGTPLRRGRHRPRSGLHPRRRARLLEGRRPCGAVRQSGRRRLHREDRGRRRKHPEVRRAGADLRKPGRRRRRHPGRQDQGRRRRRDPLRGPARRSRHAGDAVSDQLSQIEGTRKESAR